MKPIRSFRPVTALLALFCVLFMQFAVAAYACPGLNPGQQTVEMGTDMQAMAGCQGMDLEQPALCHAFDQTGNQSLDKPAPLQIPPFIPAQLVAHVEASLDTGDAIAVPAQEPALARATAPPLAIRHCCFRN